MSACMTHVHMHADVDVDGRVCGAVLLRCMMHLRRLSGCAAAAARRAGYKKNVGSPLSVCREPALGGALILRRFCYWDLKNLVAPRGSYQANHHAAPYATHTQKHRWVNNTGTSVSNQALIADRHDDCSPLGVHSSL